jgi:hypothetical protein
MTEGSMKRQRGLSIGGMLVAAVVVVVLALTVLKVVPVFLEYRTIQSNFKSMAEDPKLQTASVIEMRRNWLARTSVDDIKSMPPENIDYRRDATGWTISAEYSVRVPLFANASLIFDFHPSSDK